MLKYVPKIYHFELDRMQLGTMLAALDNNYNADRSQATTADDILRNKVAFRKATQKDVVRKVLEEKDYSYLKRMIHESAGRAMSGKKYLFPTKRAFMSLQQASRATKTELLERREKYRRFNNTVPLKFQVSSKGWVKKL